LLSYQALDYYGTIADLKKRQLPVGVGRDGFEGQPLGKLDTCDQEARLGSATPATSKQVTWREDGLVGMAVLLVVADRIVRAVDITRGRQRMNPKASMAGMCVVL
jgi:hypothetical protein